jgi:hypothetical protein
MIRSVADLRRGTAFSFPRSRLHFTTGRFWLRGRPQYLPLCGIRNRPLSLLDTAALP